jgi:hypothetical protein
VATAVKDAASSYLRMRLQLKYLFLFAGLSFAIAAAAQTAAPDAQSAAHASATVLPSVIAQGALSEVQSSTSALNISRWKAPGEVRQATQQNVDSIQRDLGNTLPGLLAQADAAPGSVPPSFAVYRNVDALYDVLLRVSETANLAAPPSEADSVASALQRLETARSQLGDAILQASQNREAQIVSLQATLKKVPAPVEVKTETIVDDGPVKTAAKTTKKKTPAKKPAPTPATGTPTASPSN